jgi:uncharacterized protein (DUF2147 family)
MRAFAVAIALFLSLAAAMRADASGTASPVGRWITEGGTSHVEIYPCGAHLCGRIAWLKEPLGKNGRPKRDSMNPDRERRAQTIEGLTFMWNFAAAAAPGEWDGGRVYNPLDGDTYRARMRMLPDGRLELRGYVLLPLFGGSQRWERVR